jgi:hypothetical protein
MPIRMHRWMQSTLVVMMDALRKTDAVLFGVNVSHL